MTGLKTKSLLSGKFLHAWQLLQIILYWRPRHILARPSIILPAARQAFAIGCF
jgi:hypothetical protein